MGALQPLGRPLGLGTRILTEAGSPRVLGRESRRFWTIQGDIPGSSLSPYLLWPHRARSHLLNGQGLLQLRAECSSVVPALALPGLPATQKRGAGFLECTPGASKGELGRRVGLAPAEPGRREAPQTQPHRHGPAEVARGVASSWQEEPEESGKASL